MKVLAWCLAAVLSQTSFAGSAGQEKGGLPEGVDDESLDLYVAKDKTQAQVPSTVVLRVNMDDGKRSVYTAETEMEPQEIDDSGFEDVDANDTVSYDDDSLFSPMTNARNDFWYHNRRYGWGLHHTFGAYHPYRDYYYRHYPYAADGYIYRYPRAHYRYHPYHGYSLGRNIYRFFKRVFD